MISIILTAALAAQPCLAPPKKPKRRHKHKAIAEQTCLELPRPTPVFLMPSDELTPFPDVQLYYTPTPTVSEDSPAPIVYTLPSVPSMPIAVGGDSWFTMSAGGGHINAPEIDPSSTIPALTALLCAAAILRSKFR